MSITVIGTIFNDIKGYPLGTFIPNGRNPGVMKIVHGGVARNVAEDLSHAGLVPTFVALTDRSALAADVVKRLNGSGVDTRFVRASDAGMGTWMAIFNDKGDVAANISIRPDLSPLAAVLDEHHDEIFADSDGIILEIDIEESAVERVFHYAKKYGVKVYALVSVMSIAIERRRFFPHTECFVCNLQEAGMLFGENLESFFREETGVSSVPAGSSFTQAPPMRATPTSMIKGASTPAESSEYTESPDFAVPARLTGLAQHIASLANDAGFSKLIVTLGEHGAVYSDCRVTDKNGLPLSGHCPAEKVKVADTTGAGDAFCAGAGAALIEGRTLAEACAAGSRMAALTITSTENVVPEGTPSCIF